MIENGKCAEKREDKCKSVSCSLEHEILRGTAQEQSKRGYNSKLRDSQSDLLPHGNHIRDK